MWFDISAAMQTRVNPVALSVPREERQQPQMVSVLDSGSTGTLRVKHAIDEAALQIEGLKRNSAILLYLWKKATAHQVDS